MGKFLDALLGSKRKTEEPVSLAPLAQPTRLERRFESLGVRPSLVPRVGAKPLEEPKPSTAFVDSILGKASPAPSITPRPQVTPIEQQRLQRDIATTGRTEAEIIASGRDVLARQQIAPTQQRLAELGRPTAAAPIRTVEDLLPSTGRQAGLQRGIAKAFLPSTSFEQPQTGFLGQAIEQKIEQQPEGVKGAEIAGRLIGTAIQYATVSKAIAPLIKTAGLTGAKAFAARQGADLLVDNIVQLPGEVIDSIKNDQTLGEDAKDIAIRNVIDIGFNALIGIPEMVKLYRTAKQSGVADEVLQGAVDSLPDATRRTIQQELGIEEGVTAQQFLKEQEQVAKDIQAEQIFKQFETDPIKDFTDWRSRNFGGATGQVSPGDMDALKQLYKEDTGIDLDVAIKEFQDLTPQAPQIQQPLAPQPKTFAEQFRAEEGLAPEPFRVEAAKIEGPPSELIATVPVPGVVKGVDQTVGDVGSFRTKVVREIKEPKTTLKEKLSIFKKHAIDDLQAAKDLEKSVTGGIASAEESLYKTARLQKGAPEQAAEIIRTELEPVIKSFEDAGGNYKDLGDYSLAIHAKDVNTAGMNSGFTNAEIDSTIKELFTPEIETARQGLLKLSDSLLEDLRKNDMLSADQLTALKTTWQNYMPLARNFDDAKVDFSQGLSGNFSNVASPIKQLKGSSREVIDPIESLIKNIYKTVDATSKNKVGVQLAKLADLDVNSDFIRRLAPGETVGRKNVVNVTLDGQKTPFEVEPEVFKMFNSLDKESSNLIVDILSKPASVLRAGATLTPEFAARNPFRDVFNAYVVSESGFNPFTDFASGLASTIKKDDMYSQWLKAGGGYGNVISMDRGAHKKALEDIIKQPVSKKFVNVVSPKGFIEMLRGITDVTESATKLGEFKKAIKVGASVEEAAFRARDLMDFSKAGSSVRPANKMVAFLNASIQGKDKLVRAIANDPKGVSSRLISSMAMPTIGIFAMNQKFANEEQKQTIADAPNWLKSTFWLVAIPGTDKVARLPKPFDISAVANATERFLEYGVNNDKEAFEGFGRQTIKDQAIPTMISGILPILEATANFSFFREAPIIPLREKGLKREDQYDVNTSELAKFLSIPARSLLGDDKNLSSPRAIDYALKSGTGGLGTSALDLSDWLLDKTGLIDRPEKPQKGITQLPVIKAFTVNELSSGKSLGVLYDVRNELQSQKNSAKLNNEPFEFNSALKFANKEAKKVSELSKKIRETTNSEKLDAAIKKKMIDKLIAQRNDISFKFVEKLKSTEQGREVLKQ